VLGATPFLIEQYKDGIYVANVPDISGSYTQDKTVEQALELIKEAIKVCLKQMMKRSCH
jgi:predicted RNase H-like HicB family nuclease